MPATIIFAIPKFVRPVIAFTALPAIAAIDALGIHARCGTTGAGGVFENGLRVSTATFQNVGELLPGLAVSERASGFMPTDAAEDSVHTHGGGELCLQLLCMQG